MEAAEAAASKISFQVQAELPQLFRLTHVCAEAKLAGEPLQGSIATERTLLIISI